MIREFFIRSQGQRVRPTISQLGTFHLDNRVNFANPEEDKKSDEPEIRGFQNLYQAPRLELQLVAFNEMSSGSEELHQEVEDEIVEVHD